MLFQFKTKDDSIFITDVQFLNWARVSSPAADQESKVVESGKLVPQGFGIYNLEGRTPKTEGPGAGLSSFAQFLIGVGQTIKVYVRANVEIKDFTMPAPIRQILYEILPSDPKQIEASIQEIANAPEEPATEPSRPQEPEVEGTVPEAAPGPELPETEASVQLENGKVEPEF